ncbi:hypothetical protein GCM10027289_23100 [Tsukamurella serpentis]
MGGMKSAHESDSSQTLDNLVVGMFLLCGPVLTAVFLAATALDSRYLYSTRDVVNGVAAVGAAVALAILALLVARQRVRGSGSYVVNSGSGVILLLSALYCGFFGWGYLGAGVICTQGACMYELMVVPWWVLWGVHAIAVLVMFLRREVRR